MTTTEARQKTVYTTFLLHGSVNKTTLKEYAKKLGDSIRNATSGSESADLKLQQDEIWGLIRNAKH